MTDFAPIIIAVSTLVTSIGAFVVAWRGSNKTDAVALKTEAVALKTDATLLESRKTTEKVEAVELKTDAVAVKADKISVQTDGHMTQLRADLKERDEKILGLETLLRAIADDRMVKKYGQAVKAAEGQPPPTGIPL